MSLASLSVYLPDTNTHNIQASSTFPRCILINEIVFMSTPKHNVAMFIIKIDNASLLVLFSPRSLTKPDTTTAINAYARAIIIKMFLPPKIGVINANKLLVKYKSMNAL